MRLLMQVMSSSSVFSVSVSGWTMMCSSILGNTAQFGNERDKSDLESLESLEVDNVSPQKIFYSSWSHVSSCRPYEVYLAETAR